MSELKQIAALLIAEAESTEKWADVTGNDSSQHIYPVRKWSIMESTDSAWLNYGIAIGLKSAAHVLLAENPVAEAMKEALQAENMLKDLINENLENFDENDPVVEELKEILQNHNLTA